MKLNWKKLYNRLDEIRQDAGLSWRQLALRESVTPSLFTRISQGKPASVKNLMKLLLAADAKLTDFVDKR